MEVFQFEKRQHQKRGKVGHPQITETPLSETEMALYWSRRRVYCLFWLSFGQSQENTPFTRNGKCRWGGGGRCLQHPCLVIMATQFGYDSPNRFTLKLSLHPWYLLSLKTLRMLPSEVPPFFQWREIVNNIIENCKHRQLELIANWIWNTFTTAVLHVLTRLWWCGNTCRVYYGVVTYLWYARIGAPVQLALQECRVEHGGVVVEHLEEKETGEEFFDSRSKAMIVTYMCSKDLW